MPHRMQVSGHIWLLLFAWLYCASVIYALNSIRVCSEDGRQWQAYYPCSGPTDNNCKRHGHSIWAIISSGHLRMQSAPFRLCWGCLVHCFDIKPYKLITSANSLSTNVLLHNALYMDNSNDPVKSRMHVCCQKASQSSPSALQHMRRYLPMLALSKYSSS